ASLANGDWKAVEVIVEEAIVREIIPKLKKAGAEGIVEYPLNKVIL
ncbi:MAG: ATP phosphoribosyltransferase, partial [Fibrobacteres bacterium]|nr:ATP phosphoribosyltransferase [Fibrobacterota bacterium]